MTEYDRRAHDPRAVVGAIQVDLAHLDYELKYADLQSAGLFVGTDCRKCDFSPQSYIPLFWAHEHQGLYGLLGKGKKRLYLAFYYYGNDVKAARSRIDQSLEVLRAKFPGRGDAITGHSLGYK